MKSITDRCLRETDVFFYKSKDSLENLIRKHQKIPGIVLYFPQINH
jgi:hypothetical protein